MELSIRGRTGHCTGVSLFVFMLIATTAEGGDFVYWDGMVREGSCHGQTSVNSVAGPFGFVESEGSPSYPGDPFNYVSVYPYPYSEFQPEGMPLQGGAAVVFYQYGYVTELPSGIDPDMGIIQYAQVEFSSRARMELSAYGMSQATMPVHAEIGSPDAPAFLQSKTAGLTYELRANSDFGEGLDDYVTVYAYLNVSQVHTCERVINGEVYPMPDQSDNHEVTGRTIGELGGDLQLLHQGVGVWEAGINNDWPFDPIASIAIHARLGDLITLVGGVQAEGWLDMDLSPSESFTAVTETKLNGSLSMSPTPGGKAANARFPLGGLWQEAWEFDPMCEGETHEDLGVLDPMWFATLESPGFVCNAVDGFFLGVQLPEQGYYSDNLFDIAVRDPETSEVTVLATAVPAGDTIDFSLLTGGPVDQFYVFGVECDPDFSRMFSVGLLFDNQPIPAVSITAVPEPTALGVLIAGMIGWLAWRVVITTRTPRSDAVQKPCP